ncbi:hypothetical protein FDP41_004753 [Naegleria fowleri]|uniref:Condensation domain-containing protein n=1 Tax=Naegleria fowleri TaxID=5763 RepID=A0A6A5BGH6_NAEFO|nr:uncharacterized protein FDP41_004753 [Naegleria fowleri]KAF0976077.1 hypothetical protein FDP41_004753 [Naegleria fowleri]CAG4712735.1 unnamed protein product [Naegleria fowleri]
MPVHLSWKRREEGTDHWSVKNHFPIPFSSELHQHLEQLNLKMPLGVVETTLGEQFYFQRINHNEFLGHHNLALIAEIKFKNNSHNHELSLKITQSDVTNKVNVVTNDCIQHDNTTIDEAQALKEKCEKCFSILKYRHPLLCSIPTLNDSVLNKKFGKRILTPETAKDIWEREIILTPGSIQFEIVENATVDIEIIKNEEELQGDTSCSIQNEDDLLCHIMQRELKNSWNCLKPNRVSTMWKILLLKPTSAEGKWLCCFSFFHAIADAQGIKHFLEEFAAIFDYVLGEQDQKTEQELEEVRTKALNDIISVTPISPIQALIQLDSLRPSKPSPPRTLRRTRPFKTDVAVDLDMGSSSLQTSSRSPSTNAFPTSSSTWSERSTNDVPNNNSRTHHQAIKDFPVMLGKWGKIVEYSKFVGRVISYNGLSPTITFPLQQPSFPNPSFTKVKLLKIPKEFFENLLNISKQQQLTMTALLHAICTLAWTLSNRERNEKSKNKSKFGFTNSITVDFREGLLIPLGKCMKVFRNFSCTMLTPVKLSLPRALLHEQNEIFIKEESLVHNVCENSISSNNYTKSQKTNDMNDPFSQNHLLRSTLRDHELTIHHKKHHHEDSRNLRDVILDIAHQTKHHLEHKYHDSLAVYQIVHKFLKFNISQKESFQIVLSNIGIVEPLVGRRVRFELLAASYSACGSTTGLSNVFHTNPKSGEMTISLCYSNALVEDYVNRYASSIMECIKELVHDHETTTVMNPSIPFSSPENNHPHAEPSCKGENQQDLSHGITQRNLEVSLSAGHVPLNNNNENQSSHESASSCVQIDESQSQY